LTPIKYITVFDVIKTKPPIASGESSIARVASEMINSNYRAVLIVNGDVKGIIDGVSLARFLLD